MDRCIIVVPCYNEAARLDTGAFQQFVAQGHPQRFLLVNDGSTDDTATVLETLRRWNPDRFDVYHLPRNMGKAEAVRRGVLRALDSRVDLVGFWDADLATPLEAISQFCDLLGNNPRLQMVIGARVKLLGRDIQRRFARHLLGRLFASVASVVLRLPVYDTQCGAKLFRVSPETRALFDRPFRTNWIFDVELLARFVRGRKAGSLPAAENAVYELPLSQWRDVAGSKVKVRDFFKSFFELVEIYWIYLRPGAAAAMPPASLPSADDAATGHPDVSHPRRRAA
jgi:glycosyltransferase involved in cell wall biosynthesis